MILSSAFFTTASLFGFALPADALSTEVPTPERLLKREEEGESGMGEVFEDIFEKGEVPTSQCIKWKTFASKLNTSAYNTIEISGSEGGIASCNREDAVAHIATSMNQGTPLQPILCGGRKWSVDICSTVPADEGDDDACRTGMTLASFPASKASYDACSCDFSRDEVFVVRPGIGARSFGGIGKTCSAESQTLKVEFRTKTVMEDPPGEDSAATAIFEESFEKGEVPEEQCKEWTGFATKLNVAAYNTVEISGSEGGIASCTSADVVARIATGMNQGTPLQPILCNGRKWSVHACPTAPIDESDDGACRTGMALASFPASKASYDACSCDFSGDDVFVVRPGIGARSFGGIGKTCSAESQTLKVEFSKRQVKRTDIFEESFEKGEVPEEQCKEWTGFATKLNVAAYNTIEISGSEGGIAKCTSADAVARIATSMNEGAPLQPILCGGRKWSVDICSTVATDTGDSACRNGMALASFPPSKASYNACACDFDGDDIFVVRPGIGRPSFGGIGKTCSAESQTLKVVFSKTIITDDTPKEDSAAAVFEAIFEKGMVSEGQCVEWNSFTNKLAGTDTYKTVEISGSEGGIAKCTSADAVAQIATSMNEGTPLLPILCDGRKWTVDICSTAPIDEGYEGACRTGTTLASFPASKSFYNACSCDFSGDDVFVVRPGIGTMSFGGIGKTCSAESQTLRVQFE